MVKIEREGDNGILVTSPYNREFINAARALRGKWTGSKWQFPAAREAAVRELCRRVYLTDGTEPTRTIRVTIPAGDYPKIVALPGGRVILQRRERDRAVGVGDNAFLVKGEFTSSGGSAKYPRIGQTDDGAVVEMYDVPQPVVDAAMDAGLGIEFVAEAKPATRTELVRQIADPQTITLTAEATAALTRLHEAGDTRSDAEIIAAALVALAAA